MNLIKAYSEKAVSFLVKYLEKVKKIKLPKDLDKKKALKFIGVIVAVIFVAILIFSKKEKDEAEIVVVQEETEIKKLVEEFGRRQALVSLVSEKEARDRAISGHYSYYATSDLIRAWQKDYENAPGRKTADPWPGRIDVDSVTEEKDIYVVVGRLIELTSDSDFKNGIFSETPIEIKMSNVSGKWLISSYKKIEALKEVEKN